MTTRQQCGPKESIREYTRQDEIKTIDEWSCKIINDEQWIEEHRQKVWTGVAVQHVTFVGIRVSLHRLRIQHPRTPRVCVVRACIWQSLKRRGPIVQHQSNNMQSRAGEASPNLDVVEAKGHRTNQFDFAFFPAVWKIRENSNVNRNLDTAAHGFSRGFRIKQMGRWRTQGKDRFWNAASTCYCLQGISQGVCCSLPLLVGVMLQEISTFERFGWSSSGVGWK